jgi:hypothetical protein
VKKCSYCGRENADEADYCYECGTAFHPEKEIERCERTASLFGFIGRPISPWIKWGLYVIVWSVVALATITKKNANFLAIFAFPLGLLSIMPIKVALMTAWFAGLVVAIWGWIFYSLLTVAIARAKRVSVFSLLYILLCVLLAVNVTGCQKLLQTAAGIE